MKIIRRTRTQLSFPEDWPGDEAIGHLTERAFGLFVWASTAVEFIRRAHYPANRLKALLQGEPTSGAMTALGALYKTALEDAGKWDDHEFVEDFRAIMGIVLAARSSLSISAIDLLLGIPSANTIALLGCLLIQHPTVRVLHPSFADFITHTDPRTYPWVIDAPSRNFYLALACLERLHLSLKQNMCNLTLSSNQLKGSLSQDVSYSCLYWIDHVCAVQASAKEVWDRVECFLTLHLLHWFEAMSISKRSIDTIKLLQDLEDWIQIHFPNQPSELVHDAYRFTRAFSDTIAYHPPSVYFLILPFAPVHSSHTKYFTTEMHFLRLW
ncbi:hypothetical protein PILCRDRAFT_326973 [Piloderma croceum F 1598]|uniref:Uncharacterized protein n=1 Tax=Piloderma croceum (strain F 1598) TaxID=765440 RepID=A0A0C3BJD2_PILCF|nr:hypothetical protein PILCRDRAFT_326973 [Piloderma croceum F 1598]